MSKDEFRRPINMVDTTEVKAPRFVGLSMLLHAAGIAALVAISATSFEKPKTEEVVIELTEAGGTEATLDAQVETVAAVEPPPMTPIAPEIPAVAAVTTPLPPPTPTKPALSTPVPPKAAVAKVIPPPPPPPAAPKETAPAPQVSKVVESKDLSLDQAPQASMETPAVAEPIAKVVTAPTPTAPVVESKVAEKLQELEEQALADFESELGSTDESLSAAEAAAKALEERNAAESAAVQARLAAVRAEAQKVAEKGQGTGTGAGTGAGEVRGIESLRQMPGNPKPSYSEAERLQRQQGEVIYLAYVDRSGRPVQFKQTKSTGHSNLDQKTLAALKEWKFYPGQEGWVEIPFRWDIRGGPQEMSALSRSKVSNKVD